MTIVVRHRTGTAVTRRTTPAGIARFLLAAFSLTMAAPMASAQILEPASGADGVFATVSVNGTSVLQSAPGALYMYFRSQAKPTQTVWLEVEYLDIGYGRMSVQYNATGEPYRRADTSYDAFVLDSGRIRTAHFELTAARFTGAQNLGADLRLETDGGFRLHILRATLHTTAPAAFLERDEDWTTPYTGPRYTASDSVDATTLNGKVIVGYQGWFRAPGDNSGQGWVHTFGGDVADPDVDLWPDMSEYEADERFPVPGWTYPDDSPAVMFSSAVKKTVVRHFQWMQAYGLHGVAVQRFAVELDSSHPKESFRIPAFAREAAARTGRTFFVMYDFSSWDPNYLGRIQQDWQYLVDVMKLTDDPRYLHHNGRPVVGLYGLFAGQSLSVSDANSLFDFFQLEGPYRAFAVGSGFWPWRTVSEVGWPELYRRPDAYIPWNIGNLDGTDVSTATWPEDNAQLTAAGSRLIPLVYPGFSWDNLTNSPPGTTGVSRKAGVFLWNQLDAAFELGVGTIYVAMFDELDEATAIFKVTDRPPVNAYFQPLDPLPSDFYLSMVGYASSALAGAVSWSASMPDFATVSQPSIPRVISPAGGDTTNAATAITWTAAVHASGITQYEVEIDGVPSTEPTATASVILAPGTHTARVRAQNGLGNWGAYSETVVFESAPSGVWRESPPKTPEAFLSRPWPNPAAATASLRWRTQRPGPARLVAYDLLGRVRTSRDLGYRPSGEHETSVHVTAWPAGVYLLVLEMGAERRYTRLTVAH